MTVQVRRTCFALALVVVLVAALPLGAQSTHRVITNHEELYSALPVGEALPPGWVDEGFEGSIHECLAHVARLRIDTAPEGGPRGNTIPESDPLPDQETWGRMYFNDANEVEIVAVADHAPLPVGGFEVLLDRPRALFVLLHPSGIGDVRQYAVRDAIDGGGPAGGAVVSGMVESARAADGASGDTESDATGDMQKFDVELFNISLGLMDIDFNLAPSLNCSETATVTLFSVGDARVWTSGLGSDPVFPSWRQTGWDPGNFDRSGVDDRWALYAYCPSGFEPGN